MTDTERQLAQLRFYREVARGELALVTAARDFFAGLSDTMHLGETSNQASRALIEAIDTLSPLLNGAVVGMSAQIEAIDATLQPVPPSAKDPAVEQSGATTGEAKAAADMVVTDQAATEQPAAEVKVGDNAA